MTDPIGTAQERELIERLGANAREIELIRMGADYTGLAKTRAVVDLSLLETAQESAEQAAAALQSRIAEVGRLETALRDAQEKLGDVVSCGCCDEELSIARAALSLQRRPDSDRT